MGFFEFFFSGADWGWRLLGLIWLIYAAGYFINNILDTYLSYRLGVKAVEAGYIIEDDDDDPGSPENMGTINDVR